MAAIGGSVSSKPRVARLPSIPRALTQRGLGEEGHNSTAKRLRILTSRTDWLANVKASTAIVREQRARKLDERGRALARDRRRVWAGRKPELENNYGPPGLVAREELTGRVFNTGDAVHFGSLDLGKTRIVKDPRTGLHTFVRAVHVHEHTEHRGGTLPDQARWHFSRARNQRELFERVERCETAEATRVKVVCRECKAEHEIHVGCGSQWFCPECRKKAVRRVQKTFLRSRQGLLVAAARARLTPEDEHEAAERDRHWGRKRKRRRPPLGGFWGERFLTLTLPHRGSPTERIEVLNATWNRFWRKLLEELAPSLRHPSGIRGADLPRGVSEAHAQALERVKAFWRVGIHRRDGAPDLERFDAEETGDYELPLADVLSYFRVLEWTPGADGKGHPHVHVWLFSQYLDQAMLERLWREAWIHVQRARLHGKDFAGPVEEARTIVYIEKCHEGIERELVKYLTKDWETSGPGEAPKRADPEVFAEVYAALNGKRRRQSSAGFSMWAVEALNECEDCGFSAARNRWNRVDITHALDAVTEPLGRVLTVAEHESQIDEWLAGEPDRMRAPLTGADRLLRAAHEARRDREWLASHELAIVRARIRAQLSWIRTEHQERVAAAQRELFQERRT